MKWMLFVALMVLLSGCETLQNAGAVECAAGAGVYCPAQIAAEKRINDTLDRTGSATCIDLVHECPFEQCPFSGCQSDDEAGDWQVIQLPDDIYIRP